MAHHDIHLDRITVDQAITELTAASNARHEACRATRAEIGATGVLMALANIDDLLLAVGEAVADVAVAAAARLTSIARELDALDRRLVASG